MFFILSLSHQKEKFKSSISNKDLNKILREDFLVKTEIVAIFRE